MAPGWAAAYGPPVHHLPELSTADPGGSLAVYLGLPENLRLASRPGTPLGDAPTRCLTALAQRIGVAEADTAAMVVPTEELLTPTDPPAVAPTSTPISPLL